MKPVFVTGIGITCALGTGTSSILEALLSKRTGISNLTRINGLHGEFLGGAAELDENSLHNFDPTLSRTTSLALEAVADLKRSVAFMPTEGTAFLNGSSVGGMDTTEVEYLKVDGGDWQQYLQHPIGAGTDTICMALSPGLERTSISTACSSSANSIMQAGRMIRYGGYHQVVAGGTDALSLFTIRGFDSLMIYDAEHCSPFDEDRAGLNLGEGAAYLLLESEENLKISGNKPLAKLSGWANANDPYHQTASRPDGSGALASMQQAIQCAQLSAENLGYINAHGTATPNNDLSEATAIKRLVEAPPPFSSTKAYTGHTLGAAGAIEAVISILALQQCMAWCNLNHSTAMEDPGLVPVKEHTAVNDMQHVLSNSFGFGGSNSTLVFSKV